MRFLNKNVFWIFKLSRDISLFKQFSNTVDFVRESLQFNCERGSLRKKLLYLSFDLKWIK